MGRTREEEPLTVARGLAPWAIAVGLHLVAAFSLYAAERPHAVAPAAVVSEPPSEIDVAFDTSTTTPSTPQVDPAPEPAAAPMPGTTAAAVVAALAAATTNETAPTNDAVVTADPNAGPTWTFRPTASADVRLGTMGAMAVAGEQHEAPRVEAPRPASSTGGLAETLAAGDVQKGLGHAGPVRTAVDNAARTPNAPTFGTATFAIILREDGDVSVQLAGASSERPGWDALRSTIRDAVKAAPKRIGVHGKGVRVVVQVEASEQFAGGGRPTPDKKQGAAVGGSIGSVTETKDHIEFGLPHVDLTYKTRQCGVGVSVNPGGLSLGGGCEPGVAMRVVSTKILAEQPL